MSDSPVTIEENEVLDMLTALVDKSLVGFDESTGRYHLLETVRQYSQELPVNPDLRDRLRNRHVDFHLSLALDAGAKLDGPEQSRYLRQLDAEVENILLAHQWCGNVPGGAEKGLRLTSAIRNYWFARGRYELGLRLLCEALHRPGAEEATAIRCRALHQAGNFAYFMGQYSEALAYLEEGLAIARSIEGAYQIQSNLLWLGKVNHALGRGTDARRLLEESLAVARAAGSNSHAAYSSTALGEFHRAAGNLEAAVRLFEAALDCYREQNDPVLTGFTLMNLAATRIFQDRLDDASRNIAEGLALARRCDNMLLGQHSLDVCGGYQIARNRYEMGVRLAGASEAALREMGVRREPADQAFISNMLTAASLNIGAEAVDRGLKEGRQMTLEQALAYAMSETDA